jgi:hypothetical protein
LPSGHLKTFDYHQKVTGIKILLPQLSPLVAIISVPLPDRLAEQCSEPLAGCIVPDLGMTKQ